MFLVSDWRIRPVVLGLEEPLLLPGNLVLHRHIPTFHTTSPLFSSRCCFDRHSTHPHHRRESRRRNISAKRSTRITSSAGRTRSMRRPQRPAMRPRRPMTMLCMIPSTSSLEFWPRPETRSAMLPLRTLPSGSSERTKSAMGGGNVKENGIGWSEEESGWSRPARSLCGSGG